MKRHYPLAPFLLFILTQYGYAQSSRELLDKDWRYTDSPEAGVHYQIITKNRDYNPRGLLIHFYSEDSVRMKGNLEGASYEGEFSFYYPNGQLEAQGAFAAGVRSGPWEEWYANGRLRERGNHVQLDEKYNFTRQPKVEYVIESFWDSTGTQHIKDGTGTYFSTFDGSRPKEKGTFANGKKAGTWLGYFSSGKPFYEEIYADGKLVSGVSYSETGQRFTYGADDHEQMPAFRGGLEGLQRYLQKSLRYPPDARRKRIQGFVFMRFVVSASGALTGIGLFTKGPDVALENEAFRVVQAMPDWIPGKQHGQPVKMEYVLPIRFVF